MISRVMFLMGRRTVQHYMRLKSAGALRPEQEPQKKKFFNPFGDRQIGQEIFYSDFKDQQVSCAEIKKAPVEKKEKDPGVKKITSVEPCAEKKKEPSEEKKKITFSGGSGSPPKCPENTGLLKRPEFPGKVRLGFIPEEWFQFFYPKTGVTGPYVFGIGLFTYLSSKEIYVMEHEYYTALSFAIFITFLVKKLGPHTAVYADKLIDKHEASWDEMHKSDIEKMYKEIDHERKEQWRADGALMLVEAKRQMIDMQLETAYREKIMQVYKEIIHRLDYQIECANVEYRLSHKHMMFWLHDQVAKAITDEHVDDTQREKRKADLSAMVVRIKDFEAAAEIRANSPFNKPT